MSSDEAVEFVAVNQAASAYSVTFKFPAGKLLVDLAP
jgi:hypothetical protein